MAVLLVGHALQVSNGIYDPRALYWLVAAVACGMAGALSLGVGRNARVAGTVTTLVLLAGIAWNVVTLATKQPALFLPHRGPVRDPVFLAGLALVAIPVAVSALAWVLRARRRLATWERWWFPVAVAGYALLGVWLIHASPHPYIDVYPAHQEAIDALRHHHSPYSVSFADIYGPQYPYYAPGLARDGRVQVGFMYPPLSLLFAAPGQILLGDFRYAQLAALLGAAALMGMMGAGRGPRLAAIAFLSTPRGLFVLEQAWTEPFAILCLAATVAASLRWQRVLGVAYGLLLAVKQHMLIAVGLAAWLVGPRPPWRRVLRLIAQGLAVAALVTVPFVAWDPVGFWRSVVRLQFDQPLRPDSLSLLAAAINTHLPVRAEMSPLISLAALALGSVVTWAGIRRTPAGFAAATGLILVLVFMTAKQAFCNYYFFVVGAWSCAVAASWTTEPESPRT